MKTTLRKSAADRREQIALAVLRIIGERGLTSLSTATIAAEVGLTTGALYRHFASMDEILVETVRQGVATIEATFPDPALPPVERLVTLARNRVLVLGSDPGLSWLLRSDQAHLALPADGVVLLRDIVQRSRAFLLETLRDGAADGSIRDDIEAELLLVPVLGTIHAVIGRGFEPSRFDLVFGALVRMLQPPELADSHNSQHPVRTRTATRKETER